MEQSVNVIADSLLNFVGDISGKRILDIGWGRGKWD